MSLNARSSSMVLISNVEKYPDIKFKFKPRKVSWSFDGSKLLLYMNTH